MTTRKAQLIATDLPASVFLVEGDRDYLLARMLSFAGALFHPRAGYMAQQALEKYLKAVSAQHDGHFLLTHDLKELAKRCAEFDPQFADSTVVSKLRVFDEFAEVGRYGAAAAYDPHKVDSSQLQVRGKSEWHEPYRRALDDLVFLIRGKIDICKLNWPDNLQAIRGRVQ